MKKLSVVLIAISLISSFTFPVSAATPQHAPVNSSQSAIITPFFTAITTANAYITISGSKADCDTVIRTSGYKTHVTLYIQKSTNNGRSYSNLKKLVDKDYYKSLVTVSASKNNLNTSYEYRTKAVVKVYDKNGNLLDSVTLYSSN